jgi:hypothetical protein
LNNVSIILTAPCLERLIEICEHPTFGPGIRKLYITPGRMTQICIRDLMSKWHTLLDDVGAHSHQMKRLEVMVHRCMDRFRNQEKLRMQGGAIELLTRAFSALKAWKHDVALCFTPDTLMYGVTTFLYSDCYEFQPQAAVPFFLTSTLQPCLEAIRSSKMNFCELEIPKKIGWCSTDFEELDIDLESFKEEDLNCFSMLTSITFALERRVNYTSVQAITAIISQARKLEVLHLSHGDKFFDIDTSERTKHSPTEFELGDDALQSISSDRIRSLNLTTMSFSKQCFLDLLQRNRDTLGALRLDHCALRDGSWTEVLSYVREALPLLRILNIGEMYYTTRETPVDLHLSYGVAMFGCGETPFEGKEKVQMALQAMIKWPYRTIFAEHTELASVQDDEDEWTLRRYRL